MIYFDNAATTLKPDCVVDAVADALKNMTNANRGVNKSSLKASATIFECRLLVNRLFNVGNPKRVIFTSGATQSLNFTILGTLNAGDHVITTALEHNSVLRPLYHMEKKGVALNIISVNKNYELTLESIIAHIKTNTKMLIMTHASNVVANVQDISKIGELCKQHGILFVVDGAQTAGLIPIDMQKMNIDALCLSAHKSLLAPQGLGILCLSENIKVQPTIFGGTGTHTFSKNMDTGYPESLEAGTNNGHAIAGLVVALKYIEEQGMDNLYVKASNLAKYFESELKCLENILIYTNQNVYSTPVVSFNLLNHQANELSFYLSNDFDIITRAGGLCAPLAHKIIGTVESSVIRFSFSHTNTKKEIDFALDAIKNFK